MAMIPGKLEQITEEDLQRLIDSGGSEGRTLDFKRDIPGRDNPARHEFLSDVCAFANVAGGDLIFGMDEDGEGFAQAIVGQEANPDDECLRLQDIVLNGLEPRLTGVHAHAVTVSDGRYAFVVRVPQSWNPPHRVKTNNHFYIREGRRKRQLDMPEVRTAVLQSDSLRKHIRDFRTDRVGKIIGGETLVPLFEGVIEVLHILPLAALLSGISVDVLSYAGTRNLPVISGGAGGLWRLNVDGVLHSRDITNDGCGAYTQLFRNGCFEAVRIFTTPFDNGLYNIPSVAYERELISFLDRLKLELTFLETGSPVILLYSLIHANKAQLGMNVGDQFDLNDSQGKFDRSVILLPDVLIEDITKASSQLLKPMFDLVWNAAGIQRSWNFDEQGNWAPRH